MNKKILSLKIFVGLFVILSLFHFSVNSTFAQCGNYFKQTYSGIFRTQFPYANVYLSDITSDGRSDFWTIRFGPGNSSYEFLIYPAKTTGYWDWDNPVIYTSPVAPISGEPGVADLDSDGKNDLYISSNPVLVFHNTGNGSYVNYPSISDTDNSVGIHNIIAFTDVNGDGLKDVIYYIIVNDTYQLRYQVQSSNGTFGGKTTILANSSQYGNVLPYAAAGDFNGDGKTDIIANNTLNNQTNNVMLKNNGNGSFDIINNVPPRLDSFFSKVNDFNNDGRADIQTGNVIYYGRADNSFDRLEIPGSSSSRYFYPAKLNNDGSWDFLELGTTFYATYINAGGNNFVKTVYSNPLVSSVFGPENSWKIEDFNNDGKDDFYDNRTEQFISHKYNVFGERVISISTNNCQSSGETKKANFDADPNTDIATWNGSTGNWSSKNAVWGNSADSSSRTFNWGSGAHGDVPALGDFDGDGKTDYSVYRNSTGVWYIFRSSDSSWMTFQFGLTGDVAVPNDYNGGGKTDIAVFRPSNGGWYIWLSETQQFLGVLFGVSEDKPVPADYDGDRKTDIAVYRPSSGVWYYLKSSDNSFNAVQWGISTDKPVPADYDGDGKADLTIYRGGVWWMLRSSNGAAAAIQYGTANDIPVPVYRNSVSADPVLYSPANNTWNYYANRYASGINVGGSQDAPVFFGLPNN